MTRGDHLSTALFSVLGRTLGLALAGTLGLTGLAAAQPSASSTLVCEDTAAVYGVNQDGSVFLYPHEEPETGEYEWGAFQGGIGQAFDVGRTVAGPDGVVYSLVGDETGELRRFQRTATGWQGSYQVVGSGWSRYAEAEHRNKVTVDEKGRLYEVNAAGELKVFVWGDGWWTPETAGGKVLDDDWGQYDLITAAGDGVLYARKGGELFRFRLHVESERWVQYRVKVDDGWDAFKHVFSPGGDVLYGTLADDGGELVWYRYLEGTNTWANGGVGRVVGNGWYDDLDLLAESNACALTGVASPAVPTVPVARGLVSAVQGTDGLLNYFSVTPLNSLSHRKQVALDDFTTVRKPKPVMSQLYTGRPSVAVRDDGKLVVQVHTQFYTDVHSVTQAEANGGWESPEARLGGRVASAPVLVKGTDGTLRSFAVADGALWSRDQSVVNGPFLPWRRLGGEGLADGVAAVENGDTAVVVARHTDGSLKVAYAGKHSANSWQDIGATNAVGTPALARHTNGSVQVAYRTTGGDVLTKRASGANWGSAWQTVVRGIASGAPAVLRTTAGTAEIVVREAGGRMLVTGQATASGPYRDPQYLGDSVGGTDPFLTNLADGTWIATWSNAQDDLYVYQGSFGEAKSATAAVYTGGIAKG